MTTDSLLAQFSAKTQGVLAAPTATLAQNLEADEEPRWLGWARLAVEDVALLLTDRRLMWASVKRTGHWQAIDILALAQHGVILPRQFLLTLAASTDGGHQRWEFRPRDPRSFGELPWPTDAKPFIEAWLRKSAEMSDERKKSSVIGRLFRR